MMKRIFLTYLVAACAVSSPASAKVLGTMGATYTISEPDALQEVEDAAKKVNWQKLFADMEKKVKHLRPQVAPLPHVRESSSRTVTMSYTLEEDMPNPRDPQRPLYPKGFTFNPLEYTSLPGKVVCFDGTDPKEVAYVGSLHDDSAILIMTAGDIDVVSRSIHHSVYYANDHLIQLFQIEAVPSVVTQEGTVLKVEEINVSKTDYRR